MRSCLPVRAGLTLLSGYCGLFVAPMLILLSEVYLRSRGWASDAAGAELNPSPREGGGCGETLLPPFPRARGRSTVSQQMPVPTVGLSLC